MRTTIELDDELLQQAQRLAPRELRTRRALVEEALRAFIQRQAARELAEAGGSLPQARAGRRRR